MATTKKALVTADELANELKLRQSALAVAVTFDTDGNPLVKVGTGVAGSKGGLFKILPIDWPLAKDILGLASQVYTPHVVRLVVEGNASAGAGADVNDWTTLIALLGCGLSRGMRFEMYETPNGNAPDPTDFVSGNLKTAFEPNVQYPMVSSQ